MPKRLPTPSSPDEISPASDAVLGGGPDALVPKPGAGDAAAMGSYGSTALKPPLGGGVTAWKPPEGAGAGATNLPDAPGTAAPHASGAAKLPLAPGWGKKPLAGPAWGTATNEPVAGAGVGARNTPVCPGAGMRTLPPGTGIGWAGNRPENDGGAMKRPLAPGDAGGRSDALPPHCGHSGSSGRMARNTRRHV